jgi:hypothetical protein
VFKVGDSLLLCACLVLGVLATGCSSSSKPSGGGGGGGGGLQFTSPANDPVIEATVPPASPQSVVLTVNQSVTWTLQNGSGFGQPIGTLANLAPTSVTYIAPQLTAAGACMALAPPPSEQQATVVATSTANPANSAALEIFIIQAPPCIATVPTNATCPPSGTVIAPPPVNTGQVFQVGTFNQFVFDDGGSQNQTPYGVAPFTWTITSGTLPNGLTLIPSSDTSRAVLSGQAVSPGCSSVTLQITDSAGVSGSQVFALVVVPPSLKVQVPNFPDAYVNTSTNVGVPYPPTALAASGGVPPYLWNYNPYPSGIPVFPTGLCLNSSVSSVPAGCVSSSPPTASSTGVISGVPNPNNLATEQNNGGPFSVQLQVSDNQQPYPAVAFSALNMTAYPLQTACPQAPDIQPSTINGGATADGSVPAVTYLQGSYAFLVHGFDANGPVAIAGSVSVDGAGNVTGGEEDIVRSNVSQNVTVLPTGSSYSIGGSLRVSALGGPSAVYNRGCMTLVNSGGTTTTFAFSLGGCSNGYTEDGLISTHDNACGMMQNSQMQNIAAGSYTTGRIVEFDDSTGQGTRASGILRAQDTASFSSGLSGLYVFGMSGWNSAGGHYAVAGSTHASSGTLSSTAADIDNAGTLSSQLTGGSGAFGSADSNGRAQTTTPLTIGPTSYDLALYQVSSNEAIMVTTDSLSASHPIIAGEAIQTTGSFGVGSLQNSHIFNIGGNAPAGPDVSVGVLHFDGAGNMTGTVYEDQAGTLGKTAVSGGYSVDTNTGRTTFAASQGQTLGSHPVVVYVIPPPSTLTRANCSQPANCITGFLVGTDSSAQYGILEFQTSATAPPPPFTSLFVAGDYAYGTVESLDSRTTNFDGTLSSDAINLNSWNQDASYATPNYCLQANCLLLMPEQTLSTSSFTVNTDGSGTFGGETASVTNGNVIFYINESPLNLYPTVMVAEQ